MADRDPAVRPRHSGLRLRRFCWWLGHRRFAAEACAALRNRLSADGRTLTLTAVGAKPGDVARGSRYAWSAWPLATLFAKGDGQDSLPILPWNRTTPSFLRKLCNCGTLTAWRGVCRGADDVRAAGTKRSR